MHRSTRHGLIILLLFSVVVALFLFISARSAGGQELRRSAPDTANGHRLAETLCTSCHLVSPQGSGPAIAGVPSFPAIANHTGQTPERLAGVIIIPHPPMPAVALTNVELRDIVAYILSLKAER
jgi:mono/diheme cytochrome c family protein